ncbi:IclR family transcriptional regulator [Agrobacterium sp. NPDC090283]|uniref:IclR family transcriptional regulator n=1 Tax=Agrobacterium sp. NPDC090283 TaxID=3363920 RepID=UPI00383AB897
MVEISQTGDQMLTVLECVARDGPVSAADVARICDINRTVAHRLLTTLSQRAYIRRNVGGGYMVGPALLQLTRGMETDLRTKAKPVMQKLAVETGETVVLHGIANADAVVIDQALGQKHLVRVEHRPGSRHSLLQGASGWSMLAFQNPKYVERVLKNASDPAGARERIALTHEAGYAISYDELQLGVHGVAVPIIEARGRCEASLAILVPAARSSLLPSFVGLLVSASREIAKQLA